MKNSEIKLGKYRHFKGQLYKVLGFARHTETLEHMVLYQSLDDKNARTWVRPLKMFMEEVEVDGKKIPRFEYIGK